MDSVHFKRPLKTYCLTEAVALSDICLFSCTVCKFYYLLTCLLTYLLKGLEKPEQDSRANDLNFYSHPTLLPFRYRRKLRSVQVLGLVCLVHCRNSTC